MSILFIIVCVLFCACACTWYRYLRVLDTIKLLYRLDKPLVARAEKEKLKDGS